ncbi:hypothetical protein [Stenotrophomonas sp.]|uniref:SpaN/EivJ family type III secretion system needle length determinant n=1 Tax=Stenotrophomonas sp. TaxID=69392 RepID=UPI0028AC619C|nr:hypothetical protein [Stenotrophomonas sp.]
MADADADLPLDAEPDDELPVEEQHEPRERDVLVVLPRTPTDAMQRALTAAMPAADAAQQPVVVRPPSPGAGGRLPGVPVGPTVSVALATPAGHIAPGMAADAPAPALAPAAAPAPAHAASAVALPAAPVHSPAHSSVGQPMGAAPPATAAAAVAPLARVAPMGPISSMAAQPSPTVTPPPVERKGGADTGSLPIAGVVGAALDTAVSQPAGGETLREAERGEAKLFTDKIARKAQGAVQLQTAMAERSAAGSQVNVTFHSWGAGQSVAARLDGGRLILQPSSSRVANALTAAALPVGDTLQVTVEQSDAANDERRRRQHRRHGE